MSAVGNNIDQMLSCFDDEARGIVADLISQISAIVERNSIYGEIAVCVVSSSLLEGVAMGQAEGKK